MKGLLVSLLLTTSAALAQTVDDPVGFEFDPNIFTLKKEGLRIVDFTTKPTTTFICFEVQLTIIGNIDDASRQFITKTIEDAAAKVRESCQSILPQLQGQSVPAAATSVEPRGPASISPADGPR